MSHPFAKLKSKARTKDSEELLLTAKRLWKDRHSEKYAFFCPQCRASRHLKSRPSPGRPRNLARIALCSVMFAILAWKWFSWKGIVSFIPFWSAFELFYRSNLRATVPCPHCGFDPFLYLVDTQLARKQIEQHWRQKFAELNIPYPEKDPPVNAPHQV